MNITGSAGFFDNGGAGRDYNLESGSTVDAGFSPAFIDNNTNVQDTITFSLTTASTNGSATTWDGSNTSYTVTIGLGAFENKVSYDDAPLSTYTFSFTTVSDGTAPDVSLTDPFTPADEDAEDETLSSIAINFDDTAEIITCQFLQINILYHLFFNRLLYKLL